jgi:hypothetical protein
MKKIFFVFLIISTTTFISCTKSFDPGTTVASKMANGWWCTVTLNGVDQVGHPIFLSTYNNAAQTDSLFIDDNEQFWEFKVQALANFSTLTFAVNNAANQYYSSNVNILSGKVLPKAGHSRTGLVTDSIYMQVQFSDDSPSYGNTYVISGTARTGIQTDDY